MHTVLQVLADSAGVQFDVAPDVQGSISYNRRDLALEDMLDAILPSIGLRWTRVTTRMYQVERAVEKGTGESLLKAARGFGSPGLTAVYFPDTTCELPDGSLSALLAVLPPGVKPVTRTDPRAKFTWGAAGPTPGIAPAHWSARWRGRLWVPAQDDYTFTFQPLGGAALLLVDGALVLDCWQKPSPRGKQQPVARAKPVKLARGWHDVAMEYHQTAERGELCLRWRASWLPEEPVPLRAGTPPAGGGSKP